MHISSHEHLLVWKLKDIEHGKLAIGVIVRVNTTVLQSPFTTPRYTKHSLEGEREQHNCAHTISDAMRSQSKNILF